MRQFLGFFGIASIFISFLLLFPQTALVSGQPRQPKADAVAARQTGALTPDSFSAKGLFNEKVLMSLYLGDFVEIPFDRDDLRFAALYGAYLNSYARRCEAYLPPDKVEMTRRECATERVTTNGWGVEISRSCVRWVTLGTGLYADQEMYQAKLKLELIHAGDAIRNAFSMLAKKDPIGSMTSMGVDAQTAISDMDALVQMNACASPGLKRFQENLRLFALNKQPIRLDGRAATSSAATSVPGAPFKDQNYTKLVEDLVSEQSKTWVMNQFVPGSVSRVSVPARDDQGRPSKIVAQYIYNGFSNRSLGSVTLTFADGLPECMYYFDFPATCRTPNRKIVAAYANGDYRQ